MSEVANINQGQLSPNPASDKKSLQIPDIVEAAVETVAPEERIVKVKDPLLEKIKRAFLIFDQQKNDTIDRREVGTILRSLGVYPSLEQLNAWTVEMEEDEPSGYITWEKFSVVAKRIMSGKYPTQDDEETIFRAFQVLDQDKQGYILPEELKKFMTTMGEPFSAEEIEDMLATCTDPSENKIFYEGFCQVLAK